MSIPRSGPARSLRDFAGSEILKFPFPSGREILTTEDRQYHDFYPKKSDSSLFHTAIVETSNSAIRTIFSYKQNLIEIFMVLYLELL